MVAAMYFKLPWVLGGTAFICQGLPRLAVAFLVKDGENNEESSGLN